MLTFMDAFSGYNQNQMSPADQEKTTLIINQGLYYYHMMPLRLNNTEVTYQGLVNSMFESQIGKTMEVYIDDMLVKSQVGIDHVHDNSIK